MKISTLLIIIFCILVIYAYCYFIFPTEVSILQTTITHFDFALLQKRQPLVVQDCVAEDDVNNLIQAWFSPNIVNVFKIDENKLWSVNNYKYCYVYALNDTELMLCPAIESNQDKAEPICLAIKMRKNQSVIIPFKWQYGNIKNNDIISYGIHDYVTWLLDIVI